MQALTTRTLLTSGRRGALALAGLLLATACAWAQVQPSSSAPADKGVLTLLSTGYGQAGIDSYVKGLYGVLREQGIPFTNIHIEYLDLVKNPGAEYRQQLSELLVSKYRQAGIQAIVTVQPAALDFLLKEGAPLAPRAPVLVAQGRLGPEADKGQRTFHFQTPTLDFAGTLQRALELFPKTQHVLFMNGNSVVEQQRQADAVRQFAPWQGKLTFDYLNPLSLEEIERRLADAVEHSIVIAPGINRDGQGHVYVPVETIVRVSKTAKAPVFPVYAVSIGQGAIGGMVSVLEDEGRAMAQSVVELLQRRPGDTTPYAVKTARPVALFDWRQIERWRGDWHQLPPDTVYLHRPPSLWGQYKEYVMAGAAVIVVLSGLVVALTVQGRRRLAAEQSLRASQQRYQLLADNMADVLWIMNLQTQQWEYFSPSVQRLLGYTPAEMLHQPLKLVMAREGYERVLAMHEARLQDYLAHPQDLRTYTEISDLRRRDGTQVWVETVTHYTRNELGQVALLGVTRDVSQRMTAEREVKQLAFYDTLTQLPNRKLLQDRMQQAMAGSARSQRTAALLFIDLDHFKTVNDTRGHEVGDLLLQEAARRLTAAVRGSDTVARLGGDEFIVILEDLDEQREKAAGEARAMAEKIRLTFERDFQVRGEEHHVTTSIGIALFKGTEHTSDELLKRADLAMYRAKAAGRDSLCFFDPEMQAVASARAALEADLRKSLQRGDFLLYYQPQRQADGSITGVEALLRWQHPQRGMVSPADFIPLSEENGLIVPLGHWVLQQACAQLVTWASDALTRDLTLAVNVSPRQFRHPEFVADVRAVLQASGADPHKLKLELTENLLLDDVEGTIAKMTQLKAQGVRFSLDDFGTGYSSLVYLKRLPLDQLKIDQSFVRDVMTNANDAAIARTVLALGESLGLRVIAEGVETEAQRDFLARHGCQAYQGYLISRPLPAADLLEFLRRARSVA
jgi:diguanylate cyclase (GGDEF)-like protein/PAS domain S-box-containing protein